MVVLGLITLWAVLAVVLALVIGSAIRLRDLRERARFTAAAQPQATVGDRTAAA